MPDQRDSSNAVLEARQVHVGSDASSHCIPVDDALVPSRFAVGPVKQTPAPLLPWSGFASFDRLALCGRLGETLPIGQGLHRPAQCLGEATHLAFKLPKPLRLGSTAFKHALALVQEGREALGSDCVPPYPQARDSCLPMCVGARSAEITCASHPPPSRQHCSRTD